MKRILALTFLILLIGCTKKEEPKMEVEQVPPPTNPPVKFDPLVEKILDESGYLIKAPQYRELIKKMFKDEPKDSIKHAYLDFIDFSLSKDVKHADSYIKRIKKEASEKGVLVQGISIFEGSFKMCWPFAWLEGTSRQCTFSMGTIAFKHFDKLLKAGNASAIEMLVIHGAAVQTDGAESSSLRSYIKDAKKHPAAVKAAQKKHAKFLEKFNEVWINTDD